MECGSEVGAVDATIFKAVAHAGPLTGTQKR